MKAAALRRRAALLWTALFAVVAVVALTGPAQAATAIVDDRGRRVELPAPPQRVVSLLPSLTETVCSLGACARLVAVDRFSKWPASVKSLPQVGGLEDTQIERVVALKPDLVLAAVSSRAVDRLESLGLRVLTLEPRSLQDMQRVIGQVAQALGDAPSGDALWRRIEQRIGDAALRVPTALRGQRVYFELGSGYAAGEASFIGQVLTHLGLKHAVPASLGPFPKLNPEFVVRAQPDIVVASERAVADMAGRPGWGGLRALRERRVCALPAERYSLVTMPGPRLGEAAEVLADCLAAMVPGASLGVASR